MKIKKYEYLGLMEVGFEEMLKMLWGKSVDFFFW